MLGYGYYYYLYLSIQYLTTLAARISAQTTGATIMRPPTAIGNTTTTQIDATVKTNRLITRSHDPRERGGALKYTGLCINSHYSCGCDRNRYDGFHGSWVFRGS